MGSSKEAWLQRAEKRQEGKEGRREAREARRQARRGSFDRAMHQDIVSNSTHPSWLLGKLSGYILSKPVSEPGFTITAALPFCMYVLCMLIACRDEATCFRTKERVALARLHLPADYPPRPFLLTDFITRYRRHPEGPQRDPEGQFESTYGVRTYTI